MRRKLIIYFSVLILFAFSSCVKNDNESDYNTSLSISETETTPETVSMTSETASTTSDTVSTSVSSEQNEPASVSEADPESVSRQCIEHFLSEIGRLGEEYIYDTCFYDIDNDNTDEFLILYYGVMRGSDLHVYKIHGEDFEYCSSVTNVQRILNDDITALPLYESDFYTNIDIKKFAYNDKEYNVILYSYVGSMLSSHYNWITALDFDETGMICEIPILQWGIDITFEISGDEYTGEASCTPHNYFYLDTDGEKEITDEEVQHYLSLVY